MLSVDRDLVVGMSPCPNDTFMFYAWLHGLVEGAVRARPWFADIEELNARAAGDDPLPMTKLSVAAFASLTDRYRLATAGAALGRGCGPLVVVREDSTTASLADLAGQRVAMPGARTTAAALLRAFGPAEIHPDAMRFDLILPAVAAGRCAAGLIIHESRFTYAAGHGLRALADLGVIWEEATGLPLPLGVIAVRRDVTRAQELQAALRASVERAFADPSASRAFVRAHAQEMDAEVCRQHIELYVNEHSIDVGVDGRCAVRELLTRAGASAAELERLEWIGAAAGV